MANNLILFDFNNLACRCIHQRGLGYGTDQRSWDLLAYMIFTIMYDFVIQCTEHFEPGDTVDVVLALDSKDGYWRRDLYPPYKADRAEKRAAEIYRIQRDIARRRRTRQFWQPRSRLAAR